jgi:hypothetical protein
MVVCGLRVIGNAVVVAGDKKVVVWNLPEGNFLPGARMNVEDSVRTIDFNNDPGERKPVDGGTSTGEGSPANNRVVVALVSRDFRYVATLVPTIGFYLGLYDTSIGRLSSGTITHGEGPLWFTPDGQKICCAIRGKAVEVAEISQDGHMDPPTRVNVADIEDKAWGCPWLPSHGHEATSDGWILGPGGKRLLMLPPHWKSFAETRVWNEKFLALLHGTLSELVILELEP